MTDAPAIKVARDLTEIIELAEQLLDQAVNDAGAMIDGTSLPGGRAMIALASVGDTDTLERRHELAEAAWMATLEQAGKVVRLSDGAVVALDDTARPDLTADEDDDTAPALQVIRYWSERYRWQLRMVWDHIPTLATEAGFLRNPDVLTHIATHDTDRWDAMATDINHARRHLESVLHAGRRPDQSRVRCNNPDCENPRPLIRTYGRRYISGWSCTACPHTLPETRVCTSCNGRTGPGSDDRCHRLVGKRDDRDECGGRLETAIDDTDCPRCHAATLEPIYSSNPAEDRWKCTSCKTRYDDAAFRAAHAQMLRHSSAQRFVSVREAIDTLVRQGRPEITVRSWLKPPRRHVADRCTVCKKQWPPSEHNRCRARVKGTLEECGGELRPVRRGNPNNVIEGYCDLATHQVYVWWPDMWRRHLITKDKADRRNARQAASS